MATRIVEGRKAPDFALNDAGGKRVSLADFKGKNVVVYFYPKDDTPGCTKEACGFRDHWKELQKAGIVVLGISPDSGASHAKFAAKYKLNFPLLSDPSGGS
jgi:peroxiredoxin Q/BCP